MIVLPVKARPLNCSLQRWCTPEKLVLVLAEPVPYVVATILKPALMLIATRVVLTVAKYEP